MQLYNIKWQYCAILHTILTKDHKLNINYLTKCCTKYLSLYLTINWSFHWSLKKSTSAAGFKNITHWTILILYDKMLLLVQWYYINVLWVLYIFFTEMVALQNSDLLHAMQASGLPLMQCSLLPALVNPNRLLSHSKLPSRWKMALRPDSRVCPSATEAKRGEATPSW